MKECQCFSCAVQGFSNVVECVPHPTPEGEKELGDTPNPGRRASSPPAPPAWRAVSPPVPPAWRFAHLLFPELCVKAFHVYAFYEYGDQNGVGGVMEELVDKDSALPEGSTIIGGQY